jgi:uncharacterized protein YciW
MSRDRSPRTAPFLRQRLLCAGKRRALAEYALQGMENKMLAAEYRTQLPAPGSIERALMKHREAIEAMRDRKLLPSKAAKPKRP